MRILVDTQCWLWITSAPQRLSPRAREIARSTDNTLFVSTVCAWEIAIKYALNKLELPEPPAAYVPSRMAAFAMQPLAIEFQHALHVAALPLHHTDPFDRLLVAQAQVEDLPILTSDPAIGVYDVETIPA